MFNGQSCVPTAILDVAIVPILPPVDTGGHPGGAGACEVTQAHTALVVPNSQIWLAGVWNQASTDALRTSNASSITTHNP